MPWSGLSREVLGGRGEAGLRIGGGGDMSAGGAVAAVSGRLGAVNGRLTWSAGAVGVLAGTPEVGVGSRTSQRPVGAGPDLVGWGGEQDDSVVVVADGVDVADAVAHGV